MTEEDVLNTIAEGELDANALLNQANPNFEKRYKRLNTQLAKLLGEVREYFPDANYYSQDGGMVLLLGASHSDEYGQPPQQELVAADSGALAGLLSGGDW